MSLCTHDLLNRIMQENESQTTWLSCGVGENNLKLL